MKTTIPSGSLLLKNVKYDYADAFQGILSDREDRVSVRDLGKAFFSASPEWIRMLMILRNKIVILFGLKVPADTANKKQQIDNFRCEPGEQLGLFRVLDKTGHEVIFGQDDTHLNFRVSLFIKKHENDKTKKELTISTTVEFNNWFGRLYFLPVRPFHKIIVPVILRSMISELEDR